MITKFGWDNRVSRQETIFKSGDFAYRLNTEWAKWPDHLKGISVPGGICDRNDNLYVTTRWNEHPIIMFDPDGNYVKEFGKGLFTNLHNLFLTKDNTLLCTDASKHNVVRELTTDGELIRNYGNFDKACDNGFDSEAWLHKKIRGEIDVNEEYSPYTAFLCQLDSIQKAGEPFNLPTRMVVASNGEMFASDGYGNAAVHKFSSDGTYIKTWGAPGTQPGQFRCPHGLWIDKLDRIWVADRENNRVHIYDLNGNLLYMIEKLIYRPADVWADDDYIYIAEVDGGITIFDMDVNIVSQLGFYFSPLRSHALCGDSKGNLYIQALHLCKANNLLKLERL